VTRTEDDGAVTVLADRFEGKRFNAPNDVVVKSDGSIWFSDPDYSASPIYEGERDLSGCQVYRIDPQTGAVRQMTDDFVMPNGLAFSPDESVLYIIDTGGTHVENGPNHVRRFRVGADDSLSGGEVLAVNAANMFDGMRVDVTDRLWMSAEDGVHCYEPDGTLIGKVILPERAGNLTFGGPALLRLHLALRLRSQHARRRHFTSLNRQKSRGPAAMALTGRSKPDRSDRLRRLEGQRWR